MTVDYLFCLVYVPFCHQSTQIYAVSKQENTDERRGIKRKREHKQQNKIKKKSQEVMDKRAQESKKREVVDREQQNSGDRSLPTGPEISDAKKKWRELMARMQSSQGSVNAAKTKPRSKPRGQKESIGKNTMLVQNKWGFLQVEKQVKANANGN